MTDLVSVSDFRKHPDVIKQKTTAEILIKYFKVKMNLFMNFLNIKTFNLVNLIKFFEFYLGEKVTDEYFFFFIQKVFQINSINFNTVNCQSDPLHNNFTSQRNYSPSSSIRSDGLYSMRSESIASKRERLRQMTSRNTENLRQSKEFIETVNLVKQIIYDKKIKTLLEIKRQFRIAQKESFRAKRIPSNVLINS